MIGIKKENVEYSECLPEPYYIGLYWEYCYKILLDGKEIGIMFLVDGENGSDYGNSDSIYIQWVEIQEEYRGKGYMRSMMDDLKKEFCEKKYVTAESSDDHLAMYLHLGFEVTARDEFREMNSIRCCIGGEK